MRLHIEELDEESGRTRTIEIDYGQAEVRVGRDRGCDLVLESPSASRKHCSLLQRADGWYVVDQASTLGTFYNGTKLNPGQEQRLSNGDLLVCSTHQLRIHFVPLTDPTLSPDPNALSRLLDEIEEEPVAPRLWFLSSSGAAPEAFPLPKEGAVLTLGRSAECDLRLEDPFRVVSAVHARVERNWAGVFLFDSSINGIYVNAQRVDGQTQLRDGDRITIAVAEEELERPLLVFAEAGNEESPQPHRGAGRSSSAAASTPAAPLADPGNAAAPPSGVAGSPAAAKAPLPPAAASAPSLPGANEGRDQLVASERAERRAVPAESPASRASWEAPGGPDAGTGPRVNWLLVAVIAVSVLALATVLVWGVILLRQ